VSGRTQAARKTCKQKLTEDRAIVNVCSRGITLCPLDTGPLHFAAPRALHSCYRMFILLNSTLSTLCMLLILFFHLYLILYKNISIFLNSAVLAHFVIPL
jgi:hypothetical protein